MKNEKTAQEIQREETEKVLRSYRAVFGQEGERTADQERVIADMKHRGYVERPVFVPNNEGALCPMRAANADGRRGFVLETLQMAGKQAKKQQPKVKK